MRNKIFCLSVILLLMSCNKNAPFIAAERTCLKTDIITKADLPHGSMRVSMKDIDAYLHFQDLAYDRKVISVDPYVAGGDTLLYIINYEEGWELIAGDKRSPATLGRSSKGEFTLKTKNKEMLCWVDCLVSCQL